MTAVVWSASRGPLLAIKSGRSRESGASKQKVTSPCCHLWDVCWGKRTMVLSLTVHSSMQGYLGWGTRHRTPRSQEGAKGPRQGWWIAIDRCYEVPRLARQPEYLRGKYPVLVAAACGDRTLQRQAPCSRACIKYLREAFDGLLCSGPAAVSTLSEATSNTHHSMGGSKSRQHLDDNRNVDTQ